MATREIDETELLAHQQVTGAVRRMQQHPEAKKLLAKANKMINPNAPDAPVDPIETEVTGVKTEIQQLREELAAERAAQAEAAQLAKFTNTFEQQKASLRQRGYTEDGIDAVIAHAQERGIADLDVAEAHWSKNNPPPDVSQPSGQGAWGFFDDVPQDDTFVTKMIESHGEDEGALRREIQATLNEVRGARR